MLKIKWDGTKLKELRQYHRKSRETISKETGISAAAIVKYERGENCPSAEVLATLADYFAIPMEYLLGLRNTPGLYEDYEEFVRECRTDSYRHFLVQQKNADSKDRIKYREEYPYNLLRMICGTLPDGLILTEDREAGIEEALTRLKEKQKADWEVLCMYFRDQKSLQEIGTDMGVSRERARQRLSRALQFLRKPENAGLLQYGKKGAKIHAETEAFDREIKRLEERKAYVQQLNKEIAELAGNTENPEQKRRQPGPMVMEDTPVWQMGLSVRSVNGLQKAGYRTAAEVADACRKDRLKAVPGLGKRSIEEIRTLLYKHKLY